MSSQSSSSEELAMGMPDEDQSIHRFVIARRNSRILAVDVNASFASQDNDLDILGSGSRANSLDRQLSPTTAGTGSKSAAAAAATGTTTVNDDDDDDLHLQLPHSSSNNRLQQLLDESPPRTTIAEKGKLVIDDSYDWSPRTPQPGVAWDTTPPPNQQQQQQQNAAVTANNLMPVSIPAPAPTPPPQHQQHQDPMMTGGQQVAMSAKRPTTWSEKKLQKQQQQQSSSAALSPVPSLSYQHQLNFSPAPLAAAASLSGVSSIFVPPPRQTPARDLLKQDTTAPGFSNEGGAEGEDEDEDEEEDPALLFYTDKLISAEEYRRMSIEARQSEVRSHLAMGWATLALRLHQNQPSPSVLEERTAKWFRRWARASDNLLERKLNEANSFLEHLSAVAAAQAQQHYQQQHQQQHQQQQHGNLKSPRSPSLSYHSAGAAMNVAALEHTATRDRKGSSPPASVTSYNNNAGTSPTGGGSIRFTNAAALQKAVLQFARNFAPVNSPPTAGQVRADGILNDMSHWGAADFGDMSYLTAPLVLVVGPRGAGKSSVVHCLTTKKPFFSTLPKVQPTVGIHAHVAQLKDVPTSTSARVTLTSEMAALVAEGEMPRNHSFALAGGFKTWTDSNIASRLTRAAPPASSSSSGAYQQLTLKSSAALRFVEVPQQMLPCLPPRMIPLSGFEVALVCDITQDGTKARRELTAQFRQVVATVVAALQERGEVQQPAIIPVYLFATHVDKMRSADRNANALVGLLRDLRLWFQFVQQAMLGGGSGSPSGGTDPSSPTGAAASPASAGGFADAAASGGPTSAANYVQFHLVDVYAVSCQEWTVVGERPRSATSFQDVASELFRNMAVLRPLTPVHVGAQILEQFVGALESYEDAAGTRIIDSMDAVKSALTIRPETNVHVANEVAVRQVMEAKGGGSDHQMANVSLAILSPAVKKIIVGTITFFTGVGRWADSCGYFVDYALFLRLILQHVPVARVVEDVTGLRAGDASFEHVVRVFGRCLQYAFVDVLSYHGIVAVEEEEGFSSVVVGPQILTRIVNCFHALQAATVSARQLNVGEKAANLFNENKNCAEFPEIGKTDTREDGEVTISHHQHHTLENQLFDDIMRDLTAWQFGVATPFAWKALLRGHLAAPLSAAEHDFFVWCARLLGPLGFLEPHWSPGHIDFVAPPTSHLQHQATAQLKLGGTSAAQQHASVVATHAASAPAVPIMLSTMFAKPIDQRSHQFLVASLTTGDDSQQPLTANATFSGAPVSGALLPQAVLVHLLHSAAMSGGEFTMQDIAVWGNCLCFTTLYRGGFGDGEDNSNSNGQMHGSGSGFNNPASSASGGGCGGGGGGGVDGWDYCCMVLMHWDLESAATASCRMVVAGASAAGSPKRTRNASGSANGNHNHNKNSSSNNDHDSLADEDEAAANKIDVSSAEGALTWLKRDIETVLAEQNPIAELRPCVAFRDGKAGSATPLTFTGIAQTAREILAGCSRGAADALLENLQELHERTWGGDSMPLRQILESLMMEERVGPQSQVH